MQLFYLREHWSNFIVFNRKCRDPIEKRVVYFRCISILNTFHNMSYLPTLVPIRLFLFGIFGLEAAVVLVRFRDRITFAEMCLAFQFGFAMFLCGILFLNISGGVYKNSCKLATRLRKQCFMREVQDKDGVDKNVNKCIKRVEQSLKPFGVSCGPTRAFTYNSMLEFFVIVAS